MATDFLNKWRQFLLILSSCTLSLGLPHAPQNPFSSQATCEVVLGHSLQFARNVGTCFTDDVDMPDLDIALTNDVKIKYSMGESISSSLPLGSPFPSSWECCAGIEGCFGESSSPAVCMYQVSSNQRRGRVEWQLVQFNQKSLPGRPIISAQNIVFIRVT